MWCTGESHPAGSKRAMNVENPPVKAQISWMRFSTIFLLLGAIQAAVVTLIKSFVSHDDCLEETVFPLFFFLMFGIFLVLMGIRLFL